MGFAIAPSCDIMIYNPKYVNIKKHLLHLHLIQNARKLNNPVVRNVMKGETVTFG